MDDDTKTVSKQKTTEEIKNKVDRLQSPSDPNVILNKVGAELENLSEGDSLAKVDSNMFKAMTLSEFQNGHLLGLIVPDIYNTLAIDMLRKLQVEYNCQSISEKATAEIATLSFIRALDTQRQMRNIYEDEKGWGEFEVKALALLSKDLDRANRQYLCAIQTLRMLKQPTMSVNIKTNTAIVGQNQLIQENQNVNSK